VHQSQVKATLVAASGTQAGLADGLQAEQAAAEKLRVEKAMLVQLTASAQATLASRNRCAYPPESSPLN
jgi:hypothetical protein